MEEQEFGVGARFRVKYFQRVADIPRGVGHPHEWRCKINAKFSGPENMDHYEVMGCIDDEVTTGNGR